MNHSPIPQQHLLLTALITITLLLLTTFQQLFAYDLSLPTFNAASFRYDLTNKTQIFLQESIDQLVDSLHPPDLRTFNSKQLLIEVIGSLSDRDDIITFYVERPDVYANSSHELMQNMMDLARKKVEQKGSTDYAEGLVISLVMHFGALKRGIYGKKECGISTQIPIEITSKFKDIRVYLTFTGAGRYEMNCEEGFLFEYDPDSRWHIAIERARLSNMVLPGSYVFKKVEFGPSCQLSSYLYLVFIKSRTDSVLTLANTAYPSRAIAFVDSVMDKLRIDLQLSYSSLLVSNSIISVGYFRCDVKSVWIVNSKINLLASTVFIDSTEQFIMYNSSLLPQFDDITQVRLDYAKTIYIEGFYNVYPIEFAFAFSTSVDLKNILINSTNVKDSMITIQGIKSTAIQYARFIGNTALSIIDVASSGLLVFEHVLFDKNICRDSIISTSLDKTNPESALRVTKSTFEGNKAGRKGVISSFLHVTITNSIFYGNEGVEGGAVYLEHQFSIADSAFYKNKATKNGGALYIAAQFDSHGTITNCDFVENQVSDLSDVTLCGTTNCDGSGGAIYYKQNLDYLHIAGAFFIKNSAVRGGAIFTSLSKKRGLITESCFFEENFASYGGGAVFHNSDKFSPVMIGTNATDNLATYFGDLYASSIANVKWKVKIGSDIVFDLPEGNQTISVYPGQLFSIIPVLSDLFNNSIPINKEVSTIKLDGGNFTIGQSSEKEFTNLFIASTGVISNSNSQSSTSIVSNSNSESKTRMKVSFLNKETNITIQILACPNNYFLKDNQLSMTQVCVYEESKEYIIAVAVSLTIVVFTLFLCSIGVLSMICYKATIKIKYWMRRDKAEKEIEKRLLESDLHPEEEEMKSVKSLNFVISIDQITLERKIGEGGSSIVYLGKWHHHPVAVKVLKLQEGYQHSDEIEQEASLLCKLRHPNIVLFFGVSLTPQKQYLIVEYLEKGSLEKHITLMKRTHQFEFIDKLKLLIDITCGMSYLHSLKVIHRDLKPGNILLDSLGVAKVCDFGISKVAGNTANSTTVCAGTISYMAPELLQSEAEKDRITPAVDVYSFSIIMYEILFEELPFAKSAKIKQFKQERNKKFESEFYNNHLVTPFSVISKVIKGVRPEIPFQNTEEIGDWLQLYMPEYSLLSDDGKSKSISIVNDYVELMQACWNAEPELRPNFETILSCISVLRQHFMDISDYSKQVSSSLSSTSTTNTAVAYD